MLYEPFNTRLTLDPGRLTLPKPLQHALADTASTASWRWGTMEIDGLSLFTIDKYRTVFRPERLTSTPSRHALLTSCGRSSPQIKPSLSMVTAGYSSRRPCASWRESSARWWPSRWRVGLNCGTESGGRTVPSRMQSDAGRPLETEGEQWVDRRSSSARRDHRGTAAPSGGAIWMARSAVAVTATPSFRPAVPTDTLPASTETLLHSAPQRSASLHTAIDSVHSAARSARWPHSRELTGPLMASCSISASAHHSWTSPGMIQLSRRRTGGHAHGPRQPVERS